MVKFYFGDLVEIKDGFYKGGTGIVIEDLNNGYYRVEVSKLCVDNCIREVKVEIVNRYLALR